MASSKSRGNSMARLFGNLSNTYSYQKSNLGQYRQLMKHVPIKARVSRLEKQVRANASEVQHFYRTDGIVSTGGSHYAHDVPILNDFINSSAALTNITGDKFWVTNVRVRIDATSNVTRMRFIIYKPRQAGSTWVPNVADTFVMSEIPNPTEFITLYDEMSTKGHNSERPRLECSMPLRMLTTFEASLNQVLRNDLHFIIIFEDSNTTPSIKTGECNTLLSFKNK